MRFPRHRMLDLNKGEGYRRIHDHLTQTQRQRHRQQDPMSHRIIEKRRRDRMNNCLADLSRLIPTDYLKKGRGRIEKTEIIEMAIKHLKYLQERVNCIEHRESNAVSGEPFRLGYQECLSEVIRYLVKGQGHFPRDPFYVQLINHLHRHCEHVIKGDVLNKLRSNLNPDGNSSSSSTSSNYMVHNKSNVSNNLPRGMMRTTDNNNGLHQHTNNFEREEKVDEIEYSRTQDFAGELSEHSINDQRDAGEEQNMNANNNNFQGLKKPEDNVNEEDIRTEFIPKTSPGIDDNENKDSRSTQGMRMLNSYSPSSSAYHYAYSKQILRNIRKGDSIQHGDSGLSLSSTQADPDYIHSYKFKNTIKQRFSQSQSTDDFSSSPSDMTNSYKSAELPYKLSHKKRKGNDHQMRHTNNRYNNIQYKDQTLSSETNSSDNITSVSQNSMYRPNNMQVANLTNGAPEKNYQVGHHILQHGEVNAAFTKLTRMGVPIFALHAKGSFYVPLNVDYECLIPFLGPYDLLDSATLHTNTSLHPITISVNFQPVFFSNKNQT